MRECFWPDSVVRISWFRGNGPDFVTGSIDMARRGIPAKHRLGPVLVTLAGDRAIASLTAIIDLPVKLQGVEGTLSTHARFLYRAERRGERWGIFGFDAIYMRDELTPSIPGEHISIAAEEVRGFRASYRMLSYYLRSQGYDIDSNFLGKTARIWWKPSTANFRAGWNASAAKSSAVEILSSRLMLPRSRNRSDLQ